MKPVVEGECQAKLNTWKTENFSMKYQKKDLLRLKILADYRIMNTRQMALVGGFTNLQSAQRRLTGYAEDNLVSCWPRQTGRRRGRPERLYTLSAGGLALLAAEKEVPEDTPCEAVNGQSIHCPDHQLLLNWFRVHLRHACAECESLHAKVLALNSYRALMPAKTADGEGRKTESVVARQREAGFVPDAAITMTDTRNGKDYLFLLEVDMGTETSASPGKKRGDFRSKIVNYQGFFRDGGYKLYADHWGHDYNGFRVLVLANSPQRAEALHRLTGEMRPSNFIWISYENVMSAKGLSGAIWSVGDGSRPGTQSIFGPVLERFAPVPELQR